MNISIVIPTNGRRHCLPLVLEALLSQPFGADDEVVIVDDASAYDLRAELAPFLADRRIALVRHDWSKGLSAARNTGIAAARTGVILLLDDDVIPARGWLEGHRAARERHAGREVVVQGRTGVHRDAAGAPFLRHAERTGWRQFASCRLPFEEREVAPAYFRAGNVSADKSFLTESGGFDELFAGPDYESQELAVRLASQGMRLVHVPGIVAQARQPISTRRACKTEFAAGRAFYYFSLKHPEAAARADEPKSAPEGTDPGGAECAALLKKIEGLELTSPEDAERLYPSALAVHFVRGLEHACRENEGAVRLAWSGDEWVALRPSKTGSLVRVQSTRGADRENDAILGALRPVPDVLFAGLGNGSHVARHAATLPPGRRCFLFEPHDYLYKHFRTRHDPRRVTRIGSVEELSVYWPHHPLQACILPALKASAAWPYAAVSEMLGTRNHLARAARSPRIRRAMVVGPIAGRASTISLHVKEAFESLGLETRFLDNSRHLAALAAVPADGSASAARQFNATWEAAEEANISAALDAKPELVFVLPRAPLSPRGFSMIKASGIISAFWLSEDHRGCPEWEGLFRHVDWFFTVQQGAFLQRLRDQQVNAHFLPLGAPLVPRGGPRADAGQVPFVGTAYPHRVRFFAALAQQQIPFSLHGVGWDFAGEPRIAARVAQSGFVPPAAVGAIYAASAISLNVHSSNSAGTMPGERDYLNARTFEIPASRGLELVDNREDLASYYEPGREVLTYESVEELADKVRYYLAHAGEAEKIAENGFRATESRHLYRHRIEQALGLIDAARQR